MSHQYFIPSLLIIIVISIEMDDFFISYQDNDFLDNSSSQVFSIEQQTEQLLNQVFNQKYQPVYSPHTTRQRQQEFNKKKMEINEIYKAKFKDRKQQYHKVYQNFDNQTVPPSFNHFLMKSQQRIDKRNFWLRKERQKKAAEQIKTLRDKPQILRGSTQNLAPIYKRCIDLQRQKEKQLQIQRASKFCSEIRQAKSHSYHPIINESRIQRSFQQYISQKEQWQKGKQKQIEKKRVDKQVKKMSQCTFAPTLVSKYSKSNSRIIPGERVQDRLLRTLDRSLQKKSAK